LAVKLAKDVTQGAGGTKGGTVIHDDGSVEQSWKGFVSLPGDKFQDRAGFQTVVSGDSSTVAVSSPMATGHGKEHTGKVQIYTRNVDDTLGVVWHQLGEDIYGDTPHEQSGYAIALNFRGDTVAIGSPYYNRTTDPHDEYEQSTPYVGQVRIFVWDADAESWNILGKPIRGTQAAGRCGFSVHMGAMGRNFVLGCPRAKDYTHVRPNAGMVKVMKWLEAEEKWVAKGSPIYGNTTNIMAGIRVSMSGDANTMAFIAPGSDDDDPSPGRVRVFNFEDSEDGDWVPMGEPIVNWDENDLRGRCMYMSRDGLNVAVGSPTKEGGGHVRIYRWDADGMAWLQRGQPVPGGGSYHSVGTSVAMNTEGEVVAVGSPFNSAKGKTAGRVRVYRWDATRVKGGHPSPGWSMKGQELDGEEGDTNGFSVHLTGKGHMITIGAPQYKWKLTRTMPSSTRPSNRSILLTTSRPRTTRSTRTRTTRATRARTRRTPSLCSPPMPTGNASRFRARTSPKALPANPSNGQRTLATVGYACSARSTASSWATLCRRRTRTDSTASCASRVISRMALD